MTRLSLLSRGWRRLSWIHRPPYRMAYLVRFKPAGEDVVVVYLGSEGVSGKYHGIGSKGDNVYYPRYA